MGLLNVISVKDTALIHYVRLDIFNGVTNELVLLSIQRTIMPGMRLPIVLQASECVSKTVGG